MEYKSVDTGKDMFFNTVHVGQPVIYERAAPGGIGIGVITKIEITDKQEALAVAGWKYGYSRYANKKIDKMYRYHIKTQSGCITIKNFSEIIGQYDMSVYDRIKNE